MGVIAVCGFIMFSHKVVDQALMIRVCDGTFVFCLFIAMNLFLKRKNCICSII